MDTIGTICGAILIFFIIAGISSECNKSKVIRSEESLFYVTAFSENDRKLHVDLVHAETGKCIKDVYVSSLDSVCNYKYTILSDTFKLLYQNHQNNYTSRISTTVETVKMKNKYKCE